MWSGLGMKEILDAYGEFFLEGLVIGLLFINIVFGIRDAEGNQGAFHLMGNKVSINNIRHTGYMDFKSTYSDECNKSMPQLQFIGLHFGVGNNKLSDYLVAYDYAGRRLPIVVKRIIDKEGVEVSDIYNRDSDEIFFQKVGIYIMEAEIRDSENRIVRYKIHLPVCL